MLEELDTDMAQRVIFITGDVGNPGTSDLINTLANRVLLKPFHLDVLHRLILEVIEAAEQL